MTPTREQWLALGRDAVALQDEHVRVGFPGGVFGTPTQEVVVDYDDIYVGFGEMAGSLVYSVARYFKFAGEAPDPRVKIGDFVRWQYARPPWEVSADLPSLAMAVCMQRLPDKAFPAPSDTCVYLEDGRVRYNGIVLPFWRLLQQLGKLS